MVSSSVTIQTHPLWTGSTGTERIGGPVTLGNIWVWFESECNAQFLCVTLPPTAHKTEQLPEQLVYFIDKAHGFSYISKQDKETDNNTGPSLVTRLQSRGTGKTEGNPGWPSGLRCTALNLQGPQTHTVSAASIVICGEVTMAAYQR